MNLEEEIRDGYTVSSYMKRIWNSELNILKKFIEVCDANNLQYWAMGGTLLGAIRHHGFIPWDNDIDVAMPRADYNRLLEIGPTAFEPPLFFQTPVTENSRFFRTFVKICDSNTTAGCREDYSLGINCGIFIDVFCFDTLPNCTWKRKLFLFQLNEIAKMRRFCFGIPSHPGWINHIKYFTQKLVYKHILHSPDAARLFIIYNRIAGKYSQTNAHSIAHLAFGFDSHLQWNKVDFENIIEADFEDIKIIIPAGYDNILRRQYGDYMKVPDDKSTHDYLEFNPDVPYDKYFGQN